MIKGHCIDEFTYQLQYKLHNNNINQRGRKS